MCGVAKGRCVMNCVGCGCLLTTTTQATRGWCQECYKDSSSERSEDYDDEKAQKGDKKDD